MLPRSPCSAEVEERGLFLCNASQDYPSRSAGCRMRIVLQARLTKHRSRPLAETTLEICDGKITSFLLTTINGGTW
jgi:hypothetical protein